MSIDSQVLVVCEGRNDQRIISTILEKLGRERSAVVELEGAALSPDRLTSPAPPESRYRRGGVLGAIKRKAEGYRGAIIVFDLEFGAPSQPAPEFSHISNVWLAPAVPFVEAWILSDPTVYSNVQRIGNIDSEDNFAQYIVSSGFRFYNQKQKDSLSRRATLSLYDPGVAATFSPSLRSFIRLFDRVAGNEAVELPFSIPGVVLSNLVQDYYPSKSVIYRTMEGGNFTGRQMAEEILKGTSIGRQYSSDLLRICRDLLARQAQKYED